MRFNGKKALAMLLALIMVLGMVPVTAAAATSGTCGDNVTWTTDGGVLTISGEGFMDNYTVIPMPSSPWSFTSIDTIKIEEGVCSIGRCAFGWMFSLKSVEIPKSVIAIGSDAFNNSRMITDIYYAGTEEDWNDIQIASGNYTLTNATIHYGVSNSIPSSKSGTCGARLDWSLSGEGVLTISGTGDMDDYASDSEVPWYSLRNEITSVIIDEGVTSIGKCAFWECTKLTSISIPDSIARIGSWAFIGCASLTGVTIPDGVGTIGWQCFSDCTSLTSITIPSSVTSVENAAFFRCTKLEDVNFLGSKAQWDAIEIGEYNESLTSATIHCSSAGDEVKVSDLSYRFDNSYRAFGYREGYRIPLERYEQIYSSERARALYEASGPWGGSCFGMSATSGMFFQQNGISTNSFRQDADRPYELSASDRNTNWDLTLTEFIEMVQISLDNESNTAERVRNANNLTALAAAVSAFQTSHNNPPVIGLWGSGVGHAVLGYAIVPATDRLDRLMVYDPNDPNTERSILLQKDAFGQYVSWAYKFDDKHTLGSHDKMGLISFVSYDTYYSIWTNRQNKSHMNLLVVNGQNAIIKSPKGVTLLTLQDGIVTAFDNQILPVQPMDAVGNSGFAHENTILWVPSGAQYVIENTDDTQSDFQVTMVNVNQTAKVTTNSAEIVIAVNDEQQLNYVELPDGSPASYSITMSSTLNQGYKNVQLAGTATDSHVLLTQVSGKLYADASDLEQKTVLSVNGKIAANDILETGEPLLPDFIQKTTGSNPFTDVPDNAWYHDAVYWAVEKGITAGTGTNPPTFTPERTCTETEILTFLWRAAGQPASTAKLPFTPKNSWAADALRWAFEKGMIGASFNESAPCTRASTAKFIWQAAGSPAASGTASFTDVPAGADYAQAVAWAVKQGITQGTGDAAFSPNATCTRAEIVTFLHRAYK